MSERDDKGLYMQVFLSVGQDKRCSAGHAATRGQGSMRLRSG